MSNWVSKFETLLGRSEGENGDTVLDRILLILLTKCDRYNSQSSVEVAEMQEVVPAD